MLETFLIGSKMKINPFDQPAVEEVKKITLKKLNNRTKNYLDLPYILVLKILMQSGKVSFIFVSL